MENAVNSMNNALSFGNNKGNGNGNGNSLMNSLGWNGNKNNKGTNNKGGVTRSFLETV